MKTFKTWFIVFAFSFIANTLYAQTEADSMEKAQTVVINMKNGESYTGQIVKRDSTTITLRTTNGELSLLSSNVKSIKENDYEGEFSFANSHDTRYFFGPTAIPIKKKTGYYQNVLLTTNFVNYGISENLSIGGGLEFISTSLGEPIWFLTPKVGFQLSDNLYLGGGFIMAGMGSSGSATLAYGVTTLGSAESNISVGVGYGLIDGDLSEYPAIMLSGTIRISNGIALLTENYVLPSSSGTTNFGIHGIRILNKYNSFDLGALHIPDIADAIPALPYVGYARAF